MLSTGNDQHAKTDGKLAVITLCLILGLTAARLACLHMETDLH